MRGLTEYSLKLMGPTPQGGGSPLDPSVPVLGGVVPGAKTARFGPTFWRPALPEGETQQTGKGTRERGPISPTQAESVDEEGNRRRWQSRTRARGPDGRGGRFPYACLLLYLCYRVASRISSGRKCDFP